METTTDSLEQLQAQNLERLSDLQDRANKLLEEVTEDNPSVQNISSLSKAWVIALSCTSFGLCLGFLLWG